MNPSAAHIVSEDAVAAANAITGDDAHAAIQRVQAIEAGLHTLETQFGSEVSGRDGKPSAAPMGPEQLAQVLAAAGVELPEQRTATFLLAAAERVLNDPQHTDIPDQTRQELAAAVAELQRSLRQSAAIRAEREQVGGAPIGNWGKVVGDRLVIIADETSGGNPISDPSTLTALESAGVVVERRAVAADGTVTIAYWNGGSWRTEPPQSIGPDRRVAGSTESAVLGSLDARWAQQLQTLRRVQEVLAAQALAGVSDVDSSIDPVAAATALAAEVERLDAELDDVARKVAQIETEIEQLAAEHAELVAALEQSDEMPESIRELGQARAAAQIVMRDQLQAELDALRSQQARLQARRDKLMGAVTPESTTQNSDRSGLLRALTEANACAEQITRERNRLARMATRQAANLVERLYQRVFMGYPDPEQRAAVRAKLQEFSRADDAKANGANAFQRLSRAERLCAQSNMLEQAAVDAVERRRAEMGRPEVVALVRALEGLVEYPERMTPSQLLELARQQLGRMDLPKWAWEPLALAAAGYEDAISDGTSPGQVRNETAMRLAETFDSLLINCDGLTFDEMWAAAQAVLSGSLTN